MNSISFLGISLLVSLFIIGVTKLIIIPLILNKKGFRTTKNKGKLSVADDQPTTNFAPTNFENVKSQNKNKTIKTIRKPIKVGDRNYEAKIQQLEIDTRKFYSNMVLPDGLKEFLTKYSNKEVPRFNSSFFETDMDIHMLGINSVLKPNDIIEDNIKQIVYTDDYFTQFRKVLFFAFDGSGHGFYFLDYGANNIQPPVRFLDSEQDKIYNLTNSFFEFKQKIKA